MLLYYFIFSLLISLSILFFKKKKLSNSLIIVFLLGQIAITLFAYQNINQTDSAFFKFDALGILFTMILSILSIASFYYSRFYLDYKDSSIKNESYYYSLFILFIVAMTAANFAQNMAILWVFVETTTLLVAGLVYFDRSKIAIEASWKYLFIGSIGIAIAFIGILFISVVDIKNGVMALNFDELIQHTKQLNPLWVKISFLFILTGFSVKLSSVPLFPASIDAKTVAPGPVNALMSTALINVGFITIFRFFVVFSHTDSFLWVRNVILIAAISSLIFSAIQLFKVKRYTRLYAFSSMEHVSLVLLGLYTGGIAYYAAILHLIFHSFIKAGLFYQITGIKQTYHSVWFKDSGNYFRIRPIDALVVLLGLILITAIPPSGLFFTELTIFKGLFLSNNIFIAILSLLLLTIIIYIIAKKIMHLLYGVQPKTYKETTNTSNKYAFIPVLILFALTIFIGIHPPHFISELINSSIVLLK